VAVVNRSRGWYERRAGVVADAQCCPVGVPVRVEKSHVVSP